MTITAARSNLRVAIAHLWRRSPVGLKHATAPLSAIATLCVGCGHDCCDIDVMDAEVVLS